MTEYFKLDDYSQVKTPEFRLPGGLEVRAFYIYSGRTPAVASTVVLHISSTSETWEYLDYSHFRLLLDDSIRIDLGPQEHHGSVGSGYVLEQFFVDVPTRDVVRIASAKVVEGALGSTPFVLTSRHQDALAALVLHMLSPDSSLTTPPDATR